MPAVWKTSQGEEVELPKLTLELSDMTDKVRASEAGHERYSAEYEFLSRVLPDDVLASAIDGDSLSSCDVVALEICYQAVVRVYTAPMIEERNREIREQVAAIRPAVDAASSIASFVGNKPQQKTIRRVR